MSRPSQRTGEVREKLAMVYEEIMWLASRNGVQPSLARAWYTHVRAGQFVKQIRRFSGKASKVAAAHPENPLVLEHPARIQTALTALVTNHLKRKRRDPNQFVRLVLACEVVNIVTFHENYAVRKHGGDYQAARVTLVPWASVPAARREMLWKRMLRGRVANASDFA